MFRQSTNNNGRNNNNDIDGEELEVININDHDNNQQQQQHEDEDEDDEDQEQQNPILNDTDHDNNQIDPLLSRNGLNSVFGYCFTKQFLKGISMIVGFLGLILTIVLLANALVSIKHQEDNPDIINYTNLQLPLWVLESIDPSRISKHVQYLSSDLLQGRGTGTNGESLSVSYIESIFRSSYLSSFNNNNSSSTEDSYIETVPLYGYNNINNSLLEIDDLKFQYLSEFVATTLQRKEEINIVDAEMVFVGYGIESEHFQWNDFKQVNVSGKILVSFVGYPSEFNVTNTYTMRWTYKFQEAQRKGALGILLIHTDSSAGYPWSVLQSSAVKEEIMLDDVQEDNPLSMGGWITKDVSNEIAKKSGSTYDEWFQKANSRDFQPISLSMKLSLSMRYESRLIKGSNVISMIKGSSNPNEYIVIMAHHDHLGMVVDEKTNQTRIFHGAIDNASGVSILLETAAILGLYNKFLHSSTFSETVPLIQSRRFDRSIVFASVTAEESGLLGSEYFLRNGPIKRLNGTIVAVMNFDVVNVYGETNDTMVFGLGFSEQYDQYLSTVCASENMTVTPDPRPQIGFLYRNDQLNFLLSNISALTFGMGTQFKDKPYPEYFNNIFTDYFTHYYHQPSDQFNSSWPFTGTVQQIKIASRLAFYLSSNQTQIPFLQNQVY